MSGRGRDRVGSAQARAGVWSRPLGASFADWMGVPAHRGGLGWGTGPVSLVLTALIAAAVGFLTASHREGPVNAVATQRS